MKNFERCYINLTCLDKNQNLKDIFEISGQVFQKLKYYNFGFHILQLDIREKFDWKCDGQIKGTATVNISNQYLKLLVLTVDKKNLSYNIYHSYGHFLQKYIFDEQKIQNIYQEYLEKSDVFDLPNDYSIIKDECVPQLIAHYFLNQLNEQAKKFVQEKILK